jgi:Na+-translocating ferredoxin:NAD+ oxidoreductase RnfD subunit
VYSIFYPMKESPAFSNVARPLSFGICLPFMIGGLVLSAREPRRWLLLYLFIVTYTLLHAISWVQIRYRLPVDVALVPFAALAVVALVGWLRRWRTVQAGTEARPVGG